MKTYDQIFSWYSENRNTNIGLNEAEYFSKNLKAGSKILDLGCGNGKPIGVYLKEKKLEVFGVDSSEKMINAFKRNLNTLYGQHSNLLDSDFFHEEFDGIIAWGVLFHLTEQEQNRAIEKISKHIRMSGRFIFTAAKVEGVVNSKMNQIEFTYTSLGAEKYKILLSKNGFELTDEYFDEAGNYIYIAKKL